MHPVRVGGRPRGQARDDPSDDAHNRLLSQRRILACAVVGLTWQIATGGENLPGVLTVPWSVASLPAPVRVREKSGPCCANREYRGSAAAWVRSNTYQTTLPLLSRIGIPPPITGGGQRSCPVLTMADTLGAISPTSRAAARRARPGSSFPGLRCHPPPGGLPRDGQLLGLRCLTRDLRVHAEVVERARNNCQSDRACPDAARDRPLK